MSGSVDHEIPVKFSATNKYKRKTNAAISLPDGCFAEANRTTEESPEDCDDEDDPFLSCPNKKLKRKYEERTMDDEVDMQADFTEEHALDLQETSTAKRTEPGGQFLVALGNRHDERINIVEENDSSGLQTTEDKPRRIVATNDQIRIFLDKTKAIDDWSSDKVSAGHLKIIRWSDKDGIGVREISRRWIAMGHGKGGKNQEANIYKLYDKHGPTFYRDKGIDFVRRTDRKHYRKVENEKLEMERKMRKAAETKQVHKPKEIASKTVEKGREVTDVRSGQAQLHFRSMAGLHINHPNLQSSPQSSPLTMEPQRALTQDQKLQALLAKRFDPSRNLLPVFKEAESATDKSLPSNDINRYRSNRRSHKLLTFKRKAGDTLLGHPTRPVLDRQSAVQYSKYLREALEDDRELGLVEYEGGIEETTIKRFIACISPRIRNTLPTHDVVEVAENGKPVLLSTRIQWSMQELRDLYLLARQLGADDVCDIILDRWHEEFHRDVHRTTVEESGDTKTFDMLDFDSDFLNYLASEDLRALEFFTDVLVLTKEAGWNVIDAHGLKGWDKTVKQMLVEKLQSEKIPSLATKDLKKICQTFHHHHGNTSGECYRVQAGFAPLTNGVPKPEAWVVVEPEATAGTASVQTLTVPSKPAPKVDARGRYWKHQQQLHDDTTAHQSHVSKRKRSEQDAHVLAATKKRQKQDEARETEEDGMKSITITSNPFLHGTYTTKEYLEEGMGNDMRKPRYVELGMQYSDKIGTLKNDGKESQLAKYRLVRKKLMEFQEAGYEVGNLGDMVFEHNGDNESDEDREGHQDEEEVRRAMMIMS
jgi:hypothetical protein